MKKILSIILFFYLVGTANAGMKILPMVGGTAAEAPVDFVTQDFTTFTEADPGSNVVITSNAVTWTDMFRSEVAYVHKDFTADYFNTDFTHRFIANKDGVISNMLTGFWCVANEVGVIGDIIDGIRVQHYVNTLALVVTENGSGTEDTYTSMADGTDYYITVTLDYDGGVNSTGRVTAYIRTGSHTGTLVDTLVVDRAAGEQNSYQYLYGMINFGSGTSENEDGYTQTLEIKNAL